MISRFEKPSSRLWKDWTASCAAGEVIGIGVTGAAAGLLASKIGEPFTRAESALVLAVMAVAGALEGLALGSFQWRVLREQLPSARARSWIGATAGVAAFGWLIGMLPWTVFAPETWASGPTLEPPFGVTLALVLAFGLAVGSLFGAAQWIVLRRHARNARKWILANALGWSAGLPWIYLAASVPTVETPLALRIVLAVAAGAAGGLSMGAITGAFLSRLSPIRVEGGVMLCAKS